MRRATAFSGFSATLLTAALLSLAVAPPAAARVCAVDNPPAATLLLPYFEVDLGRPGGPTTLFSIANAGDRGVLAHVVLWTDMGVPTLNFDVYLTGYDVQTLNLRDLLTGNLPQTASDGQDPADQISPQGELSMDVSFASCAGRLPLARPADAVIATVQSMHTGGRSLLTDRCSGQDFFDDIARGYVTVDVVTACTLLTPADPGYFEGIAAFDNVLWGDFFLVDPEGDFAQGASLVRLEADPDAFGPGEDTFYGRYVGATAADRREPLPTRWAVRHLEGGAFDGGTAVLVWRDSGARGSEFRCPGNERPSWYPLDLGHYNFFDEEENADSYLCFPFPGPCLTFFPAEANRVALADVVRNVPFGWNDVDFRSGSPPEPTQAWVGSLMSAAGQFSVGFTATPLTSSCPEP